MRANNSRRNNKKKEKNLSVAIGCWTLLLSAIILIVFLCFRSCSKSNDSYYSAPYSLSSDIAYSENKKKRWEIEKSNLDPKQDDSSIIKLAEDEFFKSLKAIDKEYGWKCYSQFINLLKKNKITIYDLYIEHTEFQIKTKNISIDEARRNGMKDIKYIDWYSRYIKSEINNFRAKYNMDERLYQVFRANYNHCYKNCNKPYCNNDVSKLKNGYIWKNN